MSNMGFVNMMSSNLQSLQDVSRISMASLNASRSQQPMSDLTQGLSMAGTASVDVGSQASRSMSRMAGLGQLVSFKV